ncbi:predicted protein [Histoplasma capsulatum H143]|uniref:Secreted protein n=1 Tax=Ajellomyces capsulatus (strain H143) TaxID=544712 RepID=C6HDT5_AJECH|nr:predicted protein [Histoplasma capsulatum H143]
MLHQVSFPVLMLLPMRIHSLTSLPPCHVPRPPILARESLALSTASAHSPSLPDVLTDNEDEDDDDDGGGQFQPRLSLISTAAIPASVWSCGNNYTAGGETTMTVDGIWLQE